MAVNIIKLIYDLIRVLVSGIRSVDWIHTFLQCVQIFCCLIGYLGLSLALFLVVCGAIIRTIQSLFLIYLCLSPRWRPILLNLSQVETDISNTVAVNSLQTPSLSAQFSGMQPLFFFRQAGVHLPYSCKLVLFIIIPLSNIWCWWKNLGFIRWLTAWCQFVYRRVGLKFLMKKIWRCIKWLKVKLRVFSWFRANIKKTQRDNGIVLELDILLNAFFYFGFRLTRLNTGSFNYAFKTPFWRGREIKSSHAAFFFLSMNFLLICWSGSILVIFSIPFLDISGIEAPGERIRYFWDSAEFGRQMRAQFKERITNYERIFQTRKRWEWDYHKQFMANLLQKRPDFKIWVAPTYIEKTDWGWFYDRVEKIGMFLFCFIGIFYFFNACDNADLGMWTPPGYPGAGT